MEETKFNGLDGEYGKSASLWLADMERRRENGSSPSMYLQHLDRHLDGEAARWVLSNPNVRGLIYKGYMELATESDIDVLYRALCDRFKLTPEEVRDTCETAPVRLLALEQGIVEGLEQYYQRSQDSLHAMHGRDGENGALTPLELSLRIIAVNQFASGLFSDRLQQWLLAQHIHHHTVSLHRAFKMAEAGTKVLETETQKARKEKKQAEKKRKFATDDKRPDGVKKRRRASPKIKPEPSTTGQSHKPHPWHRSWLYGFLWKSNGTWHEAFER